jgi:hypothetical protein
MWIVEVEVESVEVWIVEVELEVEDWRFIRWS